MEHYLLSIRDAFLRSLELYQNQGIGKVDNYNYYMLNTSYTFPSLSKFISDFKNLLPPSLSSTPVICSDLLIKGIEYASPISSLRLTREMIKGMTGQEWVNFGKKSIASSLYRITIPGLRKMSFGYSPKPLPITHINIQLHSSSMIGYIIYIPDDSNLAAEIVINDLFQLPIILRKEK